MHNRLGLPSISANYATLYINDEYMGFYVLLDSFKLSWAEYEYGDEDTTSLYQCKDMNNKLTVASSSTGCKNENKDVTDYSEWIELLTRFDIAQSYKDIEDIFDIDQFLNEIAFEYLTGSWDHYLNSGHNYYLYKPNNDKWKFLLYDFDSDLGQEAFMINCGLPGKSDDLKTNNTNFPTYSFDEWTKPRHLIDILILNNSTRFDNILRNIVKKTFNPTVLFPHIDELKSLIKPYIENDRTPDENGNYPGGINQNNMDFYTIEEWEANSEFTTIPSYFQYTFGIKYWILMRYRYICKAYKFECDPTYMDNNYNYVIDKDVEYKDEIYYFASAYKFIEEYGEL